MSVILMQTESANVPAQVQADLPIHSRPVRVYRSPHIGGSPHNSIHYISASEEVTTAPTTNRPPPPRHFPEPYFDKLAFTSGKDISSRLHPTESRNPLSPHTPRRFAPTMTNPPQFPMPWAHSRVHGQYRTTPLATGSLLNARPAYRDLGRLGTNHGTVFNRTTQTPEIDGGPAYRDLGRLGGNNAPQLKAPEQTLEIDGGPAYRDLGRLEGNNAAALEEPERSPEIDIRDPVFDSSSSDVEGGNGSPVVQEETRALEVPNLTEVDVRLYLSALSYYFKQHTHHFPRTSTSSDRRRWSTISPTWTRCYATTLTSSSASADPVLLGRR